MRKLAGNNNPAIDIFFSHGGFVCSKSLPGMLIHGVAILSRDPALEMVTDKKPRRLERPSNHAPAMAGFSKGF
jgi:hypothetical protein